LLQLEIMNSVDASTCQKSSRFRVTAYWEDWSFVLLLPFKLIIDLHRILLRYTHLVDFALGCTHYETLLFGSISFDLGISNTWVRESCLHHLVLMLTTVGWGPLVISFGSIFTVDLEHANEPDNQIPSLIDGNVVHMRTLFFLGLPFDIYGLLNQFWLQTLILQILQFVDHDTTGQEPILNYSAISVTFGQVVLKVTWRMISL
jgi:hypothetical protein